MAHCPVRRRPTQRGRRTAVVVSGAARASRETDGCRCKERPQFDATSPIALFQFLVSLQQLPSAGISRLHLHLLVLSVSRTGPPFRSTAGGEFHSFAVVGDDFCNSAGW